MGGLAARWFAGAGAGARGATLQHVAEAAHVERELAEQHVQHRLAVAADLAEARDPLDDEVGVGLGRGAGGRRGLRRRARDASARLTTSTAAPISRRSRSLRTPEIIFQKSVSAW